jgi:hypothetical protein
LETIEIGNGCWLDSLVVEVNVVVLNCSAKGVAGSLTNFDVRVYEALVEVSTPNVHSKVSPELISYKPFSTPDCKSKEETTH